MIRLGVDWGRARVGLALSDETGRFARPASVLRSQNLRQTLDALHRFALDHRVGGIVVGLPRNMDGSEGASAATARRFAGDLRARTGLPVDLWDERLSSWEADRRLVAGGTRGRRRKAIQDAAAAAVILQDYLDARRASAG